MYRSIKKLTLLISFILMGKLLPAQSVLKPFPQHVKYYAGVIKPNHINQYQLDDKVCSFYNGWKERYINHDAGDGQLYVWVEDAVRKNKCVSEGQGYGMIIVALMAGYDTTAQKIYNGLFRYFKLHPSKKNSSLMAWAQTASFKDVDKSSATDGDMDIAYSLLLADAQWGSDGQINYKQEASVMIAAIMAQEINPRSYSVLLSNSVEPDSRDYFDMRSSDFMPAHFKAFRDATKNRNWDKVIDANYQLFKILQDHYSTDAGLLPDFIRHINTTPIPSGAHYLESKYDGYYSYNACRVPWRIATDFILYGDQRSRVFAEKINEWIKETTQNNPDNISAGYTLEGDDIKTRNFEAMSFIAPFAVAAMINSKHQGWLNKLWDYIVSFELDQYDYYDNSIKMLDMIILSGNYWSPAEN